MSGEILHLDNISYIRNRTLILSGVSWRIAPGEHWALLGPNGSGKTSMLKVVTGYEWPSEGTVTVLGERFGACDLRELRKRIGWVSTSLGQQFPRHDTALAVTVSGIDASIGLYRGEIADAEWAAAREALERVGIARLAERAYPVLSQGEQQRVLIARALVSRPALLILDEACAGLDPAAREHFLEDVDALCRRPDAPATILVTHHLEEVGPWVTHVLAIREGRVVARGTKSEVLTGEVMTRVFGRPCRVERAGDRYFLRFEG